MPGTLSAAHDVDLASVGSSPKAGLIVADGLCPKIGELLPGALQELVSLGACRNPLQVIADELESRRSQGQPVETLHLVAHGRPGAFQIGGQWITAADLITNADHLAQWQVITIALWSCEVGTDRGFTTLLSELTGAKALTAKGKIYGGANHNWILQKSGNDPEGDTRPPFSTAQINAWPHNLAEVSFSPSVLYNVSATTTSTVTLGALEPGASIAQDDPAPGEAGSGDTLFNDISTDLLVRIVLSDGTIIQGEIQRRITTGSTLEALVFFEDFDGDGTVPQGGEPGGRNFVIVRTGFESSFSQGSVESTNSAPIRELVDALNLFLQESSAPITIAILGGIVSEGSTAYCAVNLSAPATAGTILTLQTTLQTAEANDFTAIPTAYYLSGTTRVPLTVTANGGGYEVVLPGGVETIYVGYSTTQDSDFESTDAALESFQVTASIPDGAGGTASASGIVTVNDSGQGVVYTIDPVSGVPVIDASATPDDDRAALSVTGGDYNEASNAAFFSVTAPQGELLTLTVVDGDTNLTAGGQPPIRYSTDGGATWQTYTVPFIVPADGTGSVLVAVDITGEQDDLFEGQETFSLSASAGGNTVSGDATINDDGTGTIIPVDADGDPTIINGNPVTDPDGPFDDDRAALSVTGGDYNEASNAAFFSVTAPQGELLTLTVVDGDTNLTAGGQPPIRYSTDGGTTWQTYTVPFIVPADGTGSVLVAVDITGEQDDLFEGQETFSLSASAGGNTVSGDATINDDGTGTIIPVDADGDPTIINGNPVTDPDGPFDDDRAALSVTGGDYNEASNAAFFSVTAPQGELLTLTVVDGDTNLTAGGQPPIRYSTDGGTTWQTYTVPFIVPADGTGSVLVAVDITGEQDDLFEGQETFSLSASAGGNTVSGDATINDDGTGTIIPVDADGDPTIINGNPVTDPDGPFDDDRTPTGLNLQPETDSGEIGDRITANGKAQIQILGVAGRSGQLSLAGPDGIPLERGTNKNYTVREVLLDDQPGKAIYIIDLIDADLNRDGAQSFGTYYQGQKTGNGTNSRDGIYTVFYDNGTENPPEIGTFEIRTNRLKQSKRIKCLNKIYGENGDRGLESTLFGFRTDKQRGTNGDDNLAGTSTTSDVLSGLKGSDLLNGYGNRLAGSSFDPNPAGSDSQVDTLTGGKGRDFFQLGDSAGSYYTVNGDSDYARITDFNKNDCLILKGGITYDLQAGTTTRNLTADGEIIATITGTAGTLNNLDTALNAPSTTSSFLTFL